MEYNDRWDRIKRVEQIESNTIEAFINPTFGKFASSQQRSSSIEGKLY